MNKYIFILLMLITGCTSIPVVKKFPPAPPSLLIECPQLSTLPADTTALSVVTKSVVKNYTLANECASKNKAWIEWYTTQQKLNKIRGYK